MVICRLFASHFPPYKRQITRVLYAYRYNALFAGRARNQNC